MNIDRAEEFAAAVSGPKAAAVLFNDISYELAMNVDSEEAYEHGEAALAILKTRFPDVEAKANEVTTPPHLSRTAWKGLRGPEPEPERESPIVPFMPPPLLSRGARRFLKVTATLAGLGLTGLAVTLGTAPGACQTGSYSTSVLTESCDSPNGGVICWLTAQGLSPSRDNVPPGVAYSAAGPDGKPWCPNALPPK